MKLFIDSGYDMLIYDNFLRGIDIMNILPLETLETIGLRLDTWNSTLLNIEDQDEDFDLGYNDIVIEIFRILEPHEIYRNFDKRILLSISNRVAMYIRINNQKRRQHFRIANLY